MTNPNSPGPMNPDGPAPYGAGGFVGALIGAGAGMYDSYQNRKVARENTQRTIAANKAEAELAYQRQVEMWHMQNLYNSPEEQMKRFGAAGLNPHLIYGQGSPGNSSSMPQYHPADMQHRFVAPTYGAAVQSVLPTLMAVGSWMQNMRLTEAEIRGKTVNADLQGLNMVKVEQLIDYLRERNPREISRLDNLLSIFPYQFEQERWMSSMASAKFQDFVRETNWKWDTKKPFDTRMMELMKSAQEAKNVGLGFQNKLLEAKSSWSDVNITDPQALIQLVLSGVMGMAGQQLRLSTHRSSSAPKRVKTFYQNGRRRSQVVDY